MTPEYTKIILLRHIPFYNDFISISCQRPEIETHGTARINHHLGLKVDLRQWGWGSGGEWTEGINMSSFLPFLMFCQFVLISMLLPLHAGRLQTVNLRGNSKCANVINKHVGFAGTDIIIIQIYSSPRLHALLHLGKSRVRFSCYIDQLSALHPRNPL